jgi:hypothetical protein
MSSRQQAKRADGTTISTPDANNATHFLAEEYTGRRYWISNSDFFHNDKREYFKHLKEINEGRKNGENWYNDKYLTAQDNAHLIEIFSSQLSLTESQSERAESYFGAFDLQQWGIKKVIVAYALCAYIVKSDERNEVRRTHPNVPESDRDALFTQMADSLDITHREFVTTYGKVRSRVSGNSRPPRVDRPVG